MVFLLVLREFGKKKKKVWHRKLGYKFNPCLFFYVTLGHTFLHLYVTHYPTM